MDLVEWCLSPDRRLSAVRNLNSVCSPTMLRQWLADKGTTVDTRHMPKRELIRRVIEIAAK